MYKPRAFKRQFAVAHDGREKTIYSGGSRGGTRGSAPCAPLFLDQTEGRIVSLAALLGERCVTSKKRLRGRVRPEEPNGENTRLPQMWYSNPKVKAICGLKLLLVLTFAPRDYGRFFFSLLKHQGFQIHREWQTIEILECKAGVKRRTLHVTNKNANERGQEIFLIVIRFVTCEVR